MRANVFTVSTRIDGEAQAALGAELSKLPDDIQHPSGGDLRLILGQFASRSQESEHVDKLLRITPLETNPALRIPDLNSRGMCIDTLRLTEGITRTEADFDVTGRLHGHLSEQVMGRLAMARTASSIDSSMGPKIHIPLMPRGGWRSGHRERLLDFREGVKGTLKQMGRVGLAGKIEVNHRIKQV